MAVENPNISAIWNWYREPSGAIVPAAYCDTRDVFEGRLAKLASSAQREATFSADESYLLAAVVGEIGNNCFDHNIGHWKYEPGLHFVPFITKRSVSIVIADRGRGVYQSLSSIYKDIKDPQSALEAAFQKRISGRFPERRGNGLKFVRQVINGDKQRGIWCQSSGASVTYGKLAELARSNCNPQEDVSRCGGTITFIVWEKDAD